MASGATLPRQRATLEDFEARGDLALDFANTLEARGTPEARDLIADYEALVAWGRRHAAVRESDGRQLAARARSNVDVAERALRRATDLRETLFALFSAIAEERPLPADGLARLERLAQDASRRRVLVPSGDGAVWRPQLEPGELDSMLWPVVEAAALLLTSERVSRIRICEGENCSRLFIDNSRRQNRRWCDMAVCGNRAKARRHYARTAQGGRRTRSVASPSRSKQRSRAAVSPASPVRTRPARVRGAVPSEPLREPEAQHEDDGFVWL